MKTVVGILLLLILPFAMFAQSPVGPAQVTIRLSTVVPESLVHGFIESGGISAIVNETTVSDAFKAEGVTFIYALETNAVIPLQVTALVSPFRQQDVLDPYLVDIQSILVDDQAAQLVDAESGTYELLDFTPSVSGLNRYTFSVNVLASKSQVSIAPPGQYISTISIGITPGS